MAELFGRAVALTIAKPTGFFLQQGSNALVIRDMRVQFEIEKHLGREPNTCRVQVTNLAENTRAAVQVKPLHVRLEAGYAGQVQRLFTGDLRWAHSQRVDADWVTELELGDGERAFRHARVNRSYRAGVDVRTALAETAKSMGLTLPAEAAGLRSLSEQFAAGLSLSGVAAEEMTALLAPFGLSWSVQDGRLQILTADGTRADQALLISQDTGMIGSPEFGPPDAAAPSTRESTQPPTTARIVRDSRKPVLTVRTLLKPTLIPGGKILVQARAVKGLFKVTTVRHQGDTHGEPFESEIEAIPL